MIQDAPSDVDRYNIMSLIKYYNIIIIIINVILFLKLLP